MRGAAANVRRSAHRQDAVAGRSAEVGWWGSVAVTDPGQRVIDEIDRESTLSQLSEDDRAAVEMSWYGFSAAEAAAAAGVSTGAAEMRRSRAKQRYRDAWRESGHDTLNTKFSVSGLHAIVAPDEPEREAGSDSDDD